MVARSTVCLCLVHLWLKPLNCGSVTNPNEPSLTNPLWTSVGQCGPVWTSVDQCGPQPSPTHCGPQWTNSPTHCSVWTTPANSLPSIRRSTLLHCRLFTLHLHFTLLHYRLSTLHFALLHFCTAVYSISALCCHSLWSTLHTSTVHSCALRAICRRQDFA